jgi:hypothetical protein
VAPSAPPPAYGGGGGAHASSEYRAPEPSARERPGLGTEWGETRESHVHGTSFLRADPSNPFAVVSLNYNDRGGVEALASYHGGSARFYDYTTGRGAITVSIHNSWGEPLEAVRAGDRTYVIGQAGERYSLVLVNHTNHRFEAVATVDGLDVVNGRSGTFENRGYILMPYATLEIDGFRQSSESVAAFRFGRVSDSYAAQTGSARNVGVIGVAFFAEQGGARDERDLRLRDGADPFPGHDPRFARPPR